GRDRGRIAAENAADVGAARGRQLKASFIDRLTLTPERIEAMAKGLEEIAALADPAGTVTAEWTRPNGMRIARVRVPIGVIGIIYESRPNVTVDAGALTMKSGNAAIMRGGSDGLRSSSAIVAALRRGLFAAGLPEDAIQMVATANRDAVAMMLEGLEGTIDVIVPRGCEVRGCPETQAADPRVIPATEADWPMEYLDAIVAMRVVGSIEEAMAHIAAYGSQHTDAIVTENNAAAERFLAEVDSAIVLHN